MKRQHKQRPLTLEDIGREFVKDQSDEVKLAVSIVIARAKQEATKNADVVQLTASVTDHERGWTLIK